MEFQISTYLQQICTIIIWFLTPVQVSYRLPINQFRNQFYQIQGLSFNEKKNKFIFIKYAEYLIYLQYLPIMYLLLNLLGIFEGTAFLVLELKYVPTLIHQLRLQC